MKYRKLGRTDLEVSVVCQGCWSIVTQDDTWGPNDLDDSLAALRASMDAGVNFFDTAEGYGAGESEEILARGLEGRRKDVTIATKVSSDALRGPDVKAHCEQSLRRLRTDYIDLYQVHWPSRDVPIAESLEAMADLRREGKIRAVGVSNFGVSFFREALVATSARVESNQLPYSLLWRPVEFEVQPLCLANDVGILCYSSLCQALLTGKFASADEVPEGRARSRLFSKHRPQSRHGEDGCEAEAFEALAEVRRIAQDEGLAMGKLSLAWLLAQPAVTSVIAGARNARQARDNALAADVTVSDDVLAALSAATAKIKQATGPNCDMWQGVSRMER